MTPATAATAQDAFPAATKAHPAPRLPKADVLTALRGVLADVPEPGDPRAEFFVRWRARTLDVLEQAFGEGAGPAERFRAIEFSPRRLSGEVDRDDALRRESCKAGCAVARRLLARVIGWVEGQPDQSEVPSPVPGPAVVAAALAFEPAPAGSSPPVHDGPIADRPPATQSTTARPADAQPDFLAPTEGEPMQAANTPVPPAAEFVVPSFPAGAARAAPAHARAAAVRRSLGRALAAWDRGAADAAAVASAKLLADLTLLAAEPQFAAVFGAVLSEAGGEWVDDADEIVAGDAADGDVAAQGHATGPLAAWALLVALGRMTPPARALATGANRPAVPVPAAA